MRLPYLIRKTGKRVIEVTPVLRRHLLSSTDYRLLAGAEEARSLATSTVGWLSTRTVARQELAYERLIVAMKHGAPRIDLRVAADAIAATGIVNPRVLEVGCGSGYYSEVLTTLVSGGVRYTGSDYSGAMIARARARYPASDFEIVDATRMPYTDGAFDIVFNGVSLTHILDYTTAIHEAARVASSFCIFHTVPIFRDRATAFLTKYAYGAPVVEIIFAKDELLEQFHRAGLRVEREWPCLPYDVYRNIGHHSTTETYLCSRL